MRKVIGVENCLGQPSPEDKALRQEQVATLEKIRANMITNLAQKVRPPQQERNGVAHDTQ